MSSGKEGGSQHKGNKLFGDCGPKHEQNCCTDHTVLPDSGPPDPQRYCEKPHGSTFQEGNGRCAKYWTKVNNTCTAADYVPLFGVPTLARLSSFDMMFMLGEQVETPIPVSQNVDVINTDEAIFDVRVATGEICVKCDGYYHFIASVATDSLDELDWRMFVGGAMTGGTVGGLAMFGRKWTSGTGHPGMYNAPIFTLPSLYLPAGSCVQPMAWTDRPGGDTLDLSYVSLERIY